MDSSETEACGRCSMSTVVDAATDDEQHADDPFGDDRIELDETELRQVSPHVIAFGRLKSRLDRFAHRLIYGSRDDDA